VLWIPWCRKLLRCRKLPIVQAWDSYFHQHVSLMIIILDTYLNYNILIYILYTFIHLDLHMYMNSVDHDGRSSPRTARYFAISWGNSLLNSAISNTLNFCKDSKAHHQCTERLLKQITCYLWKCHRHYYATCMFLYYYKILGW
jgi:hypothetical protein